MKPDPLEARVRGIVDGIPVPPALEARIRATLLRRRLRRVGVAAAILLAGAFGFHRLSLRPVPPDEPAAAVVSLAAEPPAPLVIRDAGICTVLRQDDGALTIRFENGDTSHD